MVKLGVIGYGYWGPNIVRNFSGHQDCKVVTVCDMNPAALARAGGRHPGVRMTTEADDILTSSEIDAVAVVTPVSYHFELAKKALENGKHVFVEKPFTATVAQAEELVELAESKNLCIMVDHRYMKDYAITRMEAQGLTDETLLARAVYAMYNAGPDELQRFLKRYRSNSPHDIDRLFREKYEMVQNGDFGKIALCLIGTSL